MTFKPICILICSCWIASWTVPQTRVGKCQYQENPANKSVKRKVTLGERGHEENDRAWRREVSWPSSSRRLWSPPYVSEDFQSPPEEGDFVLDGRTSVKWTLQQGQTGTTTQPNNLMPVQLRLSQWSSAHRPFFRHQSSLLILYLPKCYRPPGFLSLNGLPLSP